MKILHFNMQEKHIIEHTNTKCRVLPFVINLLIILYPRHKPHITIEHTDVKILISTLIPDVM